MAKILQLFTHQSKLHVLWSTKQLRQDSQSMQLESREDFLRLNLPQPSFGAITSADFYLEAFYTVSQSASDRFLSDGNTRRLPSPFSASFVLTLCYCAPAVARACSSVFTPHFVSSFTLPVPLPSSVCCQMSPSTHTLTERNKTNQQRQE